MMSIFVKNKETKRVIFNIEVSLAERLEKAKEVSRRLGKKLDVDAAVDKALEKFLKKAEKKLEELGEFSTANPARQPAPLAQGDDAEPVQSEPTTNRTERL